MPINDSSHSVTCLRAGLLSAGTLSILAEAEMSLSKAPTLIWWVKTEGRELPCIRKINSHVHEVQVEATMKIP
jgi:hypothetical protein